MKKHWKYLKGQFKKEFAKLLGSGRLSQDGDHEVSAWLYFDRMSFLREEFEELSGDLPMPIVTEVVTEAAPGDFLMPLMGENLDPFNHLSHNQQQENNETRSISNHPQDLEDNNSTLPSSSRPSVSARPRLSIGGQSNSSINAVGEYSRSRVTMTELCGSNDDDFFYLMSILPTMKRLTNVQKMRFRSKIEQFLLEAVSTNEYSSYINNFDPDSSLPAAENNRKRKSRNSRI